MYIGDCLTKHMRVREVEALCLQFVMLYLRHCAAAAVDVSPHQLLASSLLPVMEENLDARFTTHCTCATGYLYKSTYTDAEAGT